MAVFSSTRKKKKQERKWICSLKVGESSISVLGPWPTLEKTGYSMLSWQELLEIKEKIWKYIFFRKKKKSHTLVTSGTMTKGHTEQWFLGKEKLLGFFFFKESLQ